MSILDRLQEALRAGEFRAPQASFLPREPDTTIRAEKVADDHIDLLIVHYPRRGPEQRYELQWRPAERGDIAFGNPSMVMPKAVQRKLAEMIVDLPIGTVMNGEHIKTEQGFRVFEWRAER